MNIHMRTALLALLIATHSVYTHAADFGLAENSLGALKSLGFENTYTRIPTTGTLVSIRITDSGRIYYICKEDNSYVIYHLELRPEKDFEDKIEKDLKSLSKKWKKTNPDELLFTSRRHDAEFKKRVLNHTNGVWVRNEIVITGGTRGQRSRSRR